MRSRYRRGGRINGLLGAAVAVWMATTLEPVRAGETFSLKQAPAEPPPVDEWQFSIGLPSWVPQVAGYVGVDYTSVHTQINPDTIIQNLDMTASFAGEVRKGRFGLYGDFLYLSMSANERVGGMVTQVNIRLDQYMADLDLNYRVWEGAWGYFDVRAGCRYTSLYMGTSFIRSDAAIEHESAKFVDNVGKAVSGELQKALAGEDHELPIPPLSEEQKEKLKELIRIAQEDPELAAAIKSGVKSEIKKQKARVSKELASKLKDALDFEASEFQHWWDPYVGVAARVNLPKAFYATAKADYGGFGVGSESTYQVVTSVGCDITRSVYAELGWRYLYVDYENDGFLYDVTSQGAQLTVGIRF